VVLVHFKRLRLQVTFRCFQATPPCITKEPERFARQFPPGRSLGRLAQRGVKNFLRLTRIAQHQETKAIKLWQILFSIRHARWSPKKFAHFTRIEGRRQSCRRCSLSRQDCLHHGLRSVFRRLATSSSFLRLLKTEIRKETSPCAPKPAPGVMTTFSSRNIRLNISQLVRPSGVFTQM